jgi:hypothetical protein
VHAEQAQMNNASAASLKVVMIVGLMDYKTLSTKPLSKNRTSVLEMKPSSYCSPSPSEPSNISSLLRPASN